MQFQYVFIVLSIIAFIWLVVDIFILTPKAAMHWWNCLSHYGKSVLMTKLGINHIDDVTKNDILILYREHVKRKRLNS
jgi:hypothetical protein